MNAPRSVARDGTPAFFARVTASVSHELKNVLATISESAGLLGDLLDMTPDVGSLDRDEVLSCSATIASEIRRGFLVVKNLNRFAHSADEPLADVDLHEAAVLAAGLASYLRRACAVTVEPPAAAVSIRSDPAQVLEILHRLLSAAFEVVGPEGALSLSIRKAEAELELEGAPGAEVLAAAGDEAVALAGGLGATLDAMAEGVRIRIPATDA